MPKKTYQDCGTVNRAVSIILFLDYEITDLFTHRGESVTEPWCIHDGSGPTQFGVSIFKNWCSSFIECKHSRTYAAKYVPIANRTPSLEELDTRRIARDLKFFA